jgi:hypothetical protein
MDALRAEHQFRERQRKERANLGAGPVVTDDAAVVPVAIKIPVECRCHAVSGAK